MRNFLQNLGYRISVFMYGRNGMDAFNHFLLISALIVNIISCLPYLSLLSLLGTALIAYCIFRTLSKNLYKRQGENLKYLNIKNKFLRDKNTHKKMWDERKTHKYFKCKCGTRLRVPKGKGKIEITCPKCKTKIIKRT